MKTKELCTLLLVEDEPSDANLLRRMSSASAAFRTERRCVSSLADAGLEWDRALPDLLLT